MRFTSEEEKSFYYLCLLPIAKELGVTSNVHESELTSTRELTEFILNNIRGRKQAGIKLRRNYKKLLKERDRISQSDITEFISHS